MLALLMANFAGDLYIRTPLRHQTESYKRLHICELLFHGVGCPCLTRILPPDFRADASRPRASHIYQAMAQQVAGAPLPCQGVGPLYKPDGEKPTATVSQGVDYDNVHVLPQTPQLIALLTQVNFAPPVPNLAI